MTTYTVFDLETTGLDARGDDRIIEIAAIGLDDELAELWRFETLVAIDRPVAATDVHGITCADLVAAPTFAQVAPSFAGLVGNSVLVAHYARFDVGFLDAELTRLGGGLPACRVLDSRDAARAAGVVGSLRLADCCIHLGVTNERPHAAMGDVETSADMLRACSARGVAFDRHIRGWRSRSTGPAWPIASRDSWHPKLRAA
jgi:DNA polymerase III epsilon subunit family exonuclease